MSLDEPPVRLCCMQRHWGPVCPDGVVMCCMCFDRFAIEQLAVDVDGQRVDVCWPCWEHDQERLRQKETDG
jgi:hypothetical protein